MVPWLGGLRREGARVLDDLRGYADTMVHYLGSQGTKEKVEGVGDRPRWAVRDRN